MEWRIAAVLSQDTIMCNEIRKGIDIHAKTCTDLMEQQLTKENRFYAKTFNFRMLYSNRETSWYGYYADNAMPNFSKAKWKGIVRAFFDKYYQLANWHQKIINEVYKTGRLVGPTGRVWTFQKEEKKGILQYNHNKIQNHPVQGTSADILKLVAVITTKKLQHIKDIKIVMKVHDSLIWDTPKKYVDLTAKTCMFVFNNVPEYAEKYFGFNINVPITGEINYGNKSWGNMKEWQK